MDTENTTPQEATSKSANDIPITIDVLPGDQLRAVRFGLSRYRVDHVDLLDEYTQAVDRLGRGDPFTLDTWNIGGDMLCEFAAGEDIGRCAAREIARGELLEHVPGDLVSLLDFAVDQQCGDLEPGAAFALDATQKQWVSTFYRERMVQLTADIAAVRALENCIEDRLAKRDRMLSAKGDGSG